VNKEEKIKKNSEDIEVIKRILDGDKEAFAIIQKKYARIIASLIRRMIKDEADVNDLTQDTFIKAYNALGNFQLNYSFSSWLFKIASNTCIDFLRKKRFNLVSLHRPSNDSEGEEIIEIKDDTHTPDTDLLAKERKEALINAIAGLPDNYREIIKLRHGEDLDYSEIAYRLDLPLGTVKAHLFRARKLLYEKLKKQKTLFDEE
jgi:RNA polymerase sigma-70 factor (ECF subfamily)